MECRRHYGAGDGSRCWTILRRYSDFVNLDSSLHQSGTQMSFSLPKKKIVGNMDRDFILQRQSELQEYINSILDLEILATNINTKKFLDLDNYSINFQEMAKQHVSMALRNNPRFEIIKPLPNIGSQIRCSYFLVKDSQEPKIQKMLSWSDFGPFKSLEDKNLQSIAKSLSAIEHPFIESPDFITVTESGILTIIKNYKEGSLRDVLKSTKPHQHYLKKYSSSTKYKVLQLNDIRNIGWQILKTLEFLHSKGLPHGSLHMGNMFLNKDQIQISGITDYICGKSGRIRSLAIKVKTVVTMQDLDVYSFGHLLHEISCGDSCNSPSITPTTCTTNNFTTTSTK